MTPCRPPPALELPSAGETIPRHRSRGEELAPPAIKAVASRGGAGRATRGPPSPGTRTRAAGCGPDLPPPVLLASSAGRMQSCSAPANCCAGAGPAPLQSASCTPRDLHPSARCLLMPCGRLRRIGERVTRENIKFQYGPKLRNLRWSSSFLR